MENFLFGILSYTEINCTQHMCIRSHHEWIHWICITRAYFSYYHISINWFMVSFDREYGYGLDINAILKCTYSELQFEMLHLRRVECHYLPHKRRHRYELDSHVLYLLCDHVLKTLCINRWYIFGLCAYIEQSENTYIHTNTQSTGRKVFKKDKSWHFHCTRLLNFILFISINISSMREICYRCTLWEFVRCSIAKADPLCCLAQTGFDGLSIESVWIAYPF